MRCSVLLAFILLLAPAAVVRAQATHDLPVDPAYAGREPFDVHARARWVLRSTVAYESLAAGVITAGLGNAVDRPPEYGTHVDGFGQRYAIRLSGVATSNVMEAGLGALWGEDPRYERLGPGHPLGARVKALVRETFYARRNGEGFGLAYARIIAIPGSNFLANTWRADSEANPSHALLRTLYGFGARITRNAYEEFRPPFR